MSSPLGPAALRFVEAQPFSADPFQIEAIAAIENGESVVVTAPTGAGKTLVAEAAIRFAVDAGRRAFYTTPIKALSNQKFTELRAAYGDNAVGLLTGDNVINGEAPVVVMTTEVLRNMIYADSEALDGLGVVILDEVHYLEDPYRGSVWEEVIIHLPAPVQLVSLSATIANPEEFTGWVRRRRGRTQLIVDEHRPVPLESLYLVKDRHRDQVVMMPVFAGSPPKANPDVGRLLKRGRGRRRRFAVPRRLEVAELLGEEGLLPAIYFIFSRAGCERAAAELAASGLKLTEPDEVSAIREIAAERTSHVPREDLHILGFGQWLGVLEKGVAAHHAGMVPAFKEAVEDLFAAGLIKLVFATETLALGINMPARSVVLERLTKFTGDSHELLQAGDFTQLTGRAGRRGIDVMGSAVVLHNRFVPFEKVADIAGAGSHVLRSSFQPTYNMVANLAANYTRKEAGELVEASFAHFQAEGRRAALAVAVAKARQDLEASRQAAECDRGDIWSYVADVDALRQRRDEKRAFARRSHPGDVFRFDGGERWVLLARAVGSNPRLVLLSTEGKLRRLRPDQIPAQSAHIGALDLPEPFRPRETKYQRRVARLLREWEPDDEQAPATVSGDEAEDQPVASCPDLQQHLKWARRAARVERDLARLERRASRRGDELLTQLRTRTRLLEDWGYLAAWNLTAKGGRLRFVYNELDLLLAEVASRGLLDDVGFGELAALGSLFTFEARVGDTVGSWPTAAVAERGGEILSLSDELARAEQELDLPETRPPDPGFAEPAYFWASGVDLEDVIGEDEIAVGDFVRNCRQLLDLMRQLRDAFPQLGDTAGKAVRAIDRGIVAVGGRF